jgi:hypothetical protein
MSTPATTSAGGRPPVRPAAAARPRRTPGGAGLGQEAGAEAQRLAAAILEVLAGVRTPAQAAQALGVSLPRYYQIETRALQALVASCAPRPRGPGRSTERELAALRRQQEQLQRQLSRQQTLVRLAQRGLGLSPPKAPAPPPGGTAKAKKRQRRPVVRALRAAEALQRRSQQNASPEAAAPSGTSQTHEGV